MDDVRFALRQLRKSTSFSLTAVFALALGMCASLAMFAFVDAALLRPLRWTCRFAAARRRTDCGSCVSIRRSPPD
jgi:predicted lysophospholipase L1 biosynthesis ABC-type transport system permease subunit